MFGSSVHHAVLWFCGTWALAALLIVVYVVRFEGASLRDAATILSFVAMSLALDAGRHPLSAWLTAGRFDVLAIVLQALFIITSVTIVVREKNRFLKWCAIGVAALIVFGSGLDIVAHAGSS